MYIYIYIYIYIYTVLLTVSVGTTSFMSLQSFSKLITVIIGTVIS